MTLPFLAGGLGETLPQPFTAELMTELTNHFWNAR
jgi:hypothetical protein